MRKLSLILFNAVAISAIVIAAYAISVSNSYRASIQLVTPGLMVFSSCTSSGPANPITSISMGTLQVGGTSNPITLFIENTVNGTVRLDWNSTIARASNGLTDSWIISPYSYELSNSNCAPDGQANVLGNGNYVNETYLAEAHVLETVYSIQASSAAVPGAYSWTLNIGAH